MKILILGGDGMLGHMAVKYFKKEGYDVFSTTRGTLGLGKIPLNLSSYSFELQSWMNQCLLNGWIPDYIINCIGIIKPYSEKNMQETIYVNAMFPHILSKQSKKLGIKLFHITTDCVYSGKLGQYSETDISDSVDVYDITKSFGEKSAISSMLIKCSIIGREVHTGNSLIEWVLKQPLGATINGYTNYIGMASLLCFFLK